MVPARDPDGVWAEAHIAVINNTSTAQKRSTGWFVNRFVMVTPNSCPQTGSRGLKFKLHYDDTFPLSGFISPLSNCPGQRIQQHWIAAKLFDIADSSIGKHSDLHARHSLEMHSPGQFRI